MPRAKTGNDGEWPGIWYDSHFVFKMFHQPSLEGSWLCRNLHGLVTRPWCLRAMTSCC